MKANCKKLQAIPSRMKSAFLLIATALSSTIGVFGTPTTPHNATVSSIPANSSISPPAVTKSINGTELASANGTNATHTPSWVCVSISPSTLDVGASLGDTERAALKAAQTDCGQSDCIVDQCLENGCLSVEFGFTAGRNVIVIAAAEGFGSEDAAIATEGSEEFCERHAFGCEGPGTFCTSSKYI